MTTGIQTATIHYQSTESGHDSLDGILNQFKEAQALLDGTHVDLVVTCEGMAAVMWESKQKTESVQRPGVLWNTYADFAQRNRCTIAGSIMLEETGKVFNALVFFGPDGKPCGTYRKAFPTLRDLF